MSLVRSLFKTSIGQWMRANSGKPFIGPVIRVISRISKWVDFTSMRWRPAHRKHDLKQAAILKDFEDKTSHANATTASKGDSL